MRENLYQKRFNETEKDLQDKQNDVTLKNNLVYTKIQLRRIQNYKI